MSAEQGILTWKVIPQTCGMYEVSNFGDIRETDSGRMLPVFQNSKGYAIASLTRLRKLVNVHSVVAELFVPKPSGSGNRLPPLQVDHIDGARMNNDARNLRWVTAAENRKNAHRRGKYELRGKGKRICRICLATGESQVFGTLTEAADSVGMGMSSVKDRLMTGRPTRNGYMFVYMEAGDGSE